MIQVPQVVCEVVYGNSLGTLEHVLPSSETRNTTQQTAAGSLADKGPKHWEKRAFL